MYTYVRHVALGFISPTSKPLFEGVALGEELLESSRLLIQKIKALLQAGSVVVSGLLNKEVVLQHLLGYRRREERLVLVCGYLYEGGLLSGDFLELGDDAFGRVVVRRGKNLLAVEGGRVLDRGLDELACASLVSVVGKTVSAGYLPISSAVSRRGNSALGPTGYARV